MVNVPDGARHARDRDGIPENYSLEVEMNRLKTLSLLFLLCLVGSPAIAQTPTLEDRLKSAESTYATFEIQLNDLESRINSFQQRLNDLASQLSAGAVPLTESSVEESEVAASVAEPAAESDGNVDRDDIADQIIEAAEQSDDLSRREKRRIKRVMNAKRGRLLKMKNVAIDQAVEEMLVAEVIVATPDGVEANWNFQAILEFLEGLLPIILQIISIFGG